MLTARPESVQIIASDTPLAIARASAEPRSAIESNTPSIPLTVPIRPSNGAIGTSVRSTSRFAVIAVLAREIIPRRIWRAHQERRSARACQAASVSFTCSGRTQWKYQTRSITSVHIRSPHRKIQTTKGPPCETRSDTAASGEDSCVRSDSSMAGSLEGVPAEQAALVALAHSLEALREQPRALLVEDLHHASRHRGEAGVDEEQRDRDPEPEHRGDHGLADAVRHQARIARARLGDALEGDDHADHGADQPQQRAGRDGEPQQRLEAVEPRDLAQHGLGDAELDDLRVLLDRVRVGVDRGEHATERVVLARLVEPGELPAHREARADQVEGLVEREQPRDDADEDDHVADGLALLD